MGSCGHGIAGVVKGHGDGNEANSTTRNKFWGRHIFNPARGFRIDPLRLSTAVMGSSHSEISRCSAARPGLIPTHMRQISSCVTTGDSTSLHTHPHPASSGLRPIQSGNSSYTKAAVSHLRDLQPGLCKAKSQVVPQLRLRPRPSELQANVGHWGNSPPIAHWN